MLNPDHQARALGYDSYADYLLSDRWAQNRRAANKPSRCWICRSRHRLHYHHRTYERLGFEHTDDLVVLCEHCHSAVHDFARRHDVDIFIAHERYKIYLKQNRKAVARSKAGSTYYAPTAGMRTSVKRKKRRIAPVITKRITPT